MILRIKNMVCNRCIEAVEEELRKIDLPVTSVQLGEVTVSKTVAPSVLEELSIALKNRGFELLNDDASKMADRIKTLIIDIIHHKKERPDTNLSVYLEDKLNTDYSTLSSLFSSLEGVTIEQFTIRQKIERVKELIAYRELNLSEIAYDLNYSSVQHLSKQFRKVTGMSPSEFKKLQSPDRKPLDRI